MPHPRHRAKMLRHARQGEPQSCDGFAKRSLDTGRWPAGYRPRRNRDPPGSPAKISPSRTRYCRGACACCRTSPGRRPSLPRRNQTVQSACSAIWETIASRSCSATASGATAERSPTRASAGRLPCARRRICRPAASPPGGRSSAWRTHSNASANRPLLNEGCNVLMNSWGLIVVTLCAEKSVCIGNIPFRTGG